MFTLTGFVPSKMSSSRIIFLALPEDMEKLRLENMSLCQRVFRKKKQKTNIYPSLNERNSTDYMCSKIFSHMKELEVDFPTADDGSVIARVKRLHFYSVREEFIIVWKHHEQFLLDYEERVKRTIQRHAKIGNYYVTQLMMAVKNSSICINLQQF